MGLIESVSMVELLKAVPDKYGTILIDPPWRFNNRTGKVGPEHKRLHRYQTLSFEEIAALPVGNLALPKCHLYLWCPNALLIRSTQRHEGLGIHLQDQHRVVQGSQGRGGRTVEVFGCTLGAGI